MYRLSVLCSRQMRIVYFVFFGICGCSDGGNTHQSGEAISGGFADKHDELEALVEMIRDDEGLNMVSDNWTDPGEVQTIGLSTDRIQEYRSMLDTLGIDGGFRASRDPEDMRFVVSTGGLGVSGSSKGYAYLGKEPDLVVDDVDTYQPEEKGSYTVFQHIQGNWYVFFQYEW